MLPFQLSWRTGAKIKKSGFTLIELLGGVGILGILGAVASDIFINVSRSYNKANVIAEIQRSGNASLSQIGSEIRNAQSVTSPEPITLNVVNSVGSAVAYTFVPEDADNQKNGYVARNGNPLTDNDYFTGVNVTGLSFFVAETDPPNVNIVLSLTQPLGAGSRIDFQASTTLTTTVSLRTY